MQRLWTLVPGHLSSHSALSSYGLFAPLTLWRLSVSLRSLVQTLGSCQASGALWCSAMPPSLGRGRVTNNNNNMVSFISSFYVKIDAAFPAFPFNNFDRCGFKLVHVALAVLRENYIVFTTTSIFLNEL